MSEKLAFDTRLYTPETPPQTVASDLAALALEASTVYQRVTYFPHFAPQLLWDTPANRVSSVRTQAEQALLNQHQHQSGTIISISPPSDEYGWPEARVNLICTDRAENYGIALKPTEYAALTGSSTPPSEHPYFLPYDLASLSVALNLPEAIWNDIVSGEAKKRKAEADQVAMPIALGLLGLAQSSTDHVVIGAWAETQMAQAGYHMMGSGSGCGLTNTEILASKNASLTTTIDSSHSCPAIVCPKCGWTANSSEASDVQSGRLTLCPTCSYNPTTQQIEVSGQLSNTQTSTSSISRAPEYFQTPTSFFVFSSPDISPKPKQDFLVGLLFPWLLEPQDAAA